MEGYLTLQRQQASVTKSCHHLCPSVAALGTRYENEPIPRRHTLTHSPAMAVQVASTRGGHSTATPHVRCLLAFSNLGPRRPRGQVLGLSLRDAGRESQAARGRAPFPSLGHAKEGCAHAPALRSKEEMAANGGVSPCYQPQSSISLMLPMPICLSASKWSR